MGILFARLEPSRVFIVGIFMLITPKPCIYSRQTIALKANNLRSHDIIRSDYECECVGITIIRNPAVRRID